MRQEEIDIIKGYRSEDERTPIMKKWRVHFFDKFGDETRSLVVEAENSDMAEDKACEEADKRGWHSGFRTDEAIEIDD